MPNAPLLATNIVNYRNLIRAQLPEINVKHPFIFCRIHSEGTSVPDQILLTATDAANLKNALFNLLIPNYLPPYVSKQRGDRFLISELGRFLEAIELQQNYSEINLRGISRTNMPLHLNDDISIKLVAHKDIPANLDLISKAWAEFSLHLSAYPRLRGYIERNAPIDHFYESLSRFAESYSV